MAGSPSTGNTHAFWSGAVSGSEQSVQADVHYELKQLLQKVNKMHAVRPSDEHQRAVAALEKCSQAIEAVIQEGVAPSAPSL